MCSGKNFHLLHVVSQTEIYVKESRFVFILILQHVFAKKVLTDILLFDGYILLLK